VTRTANIRLDPIATERRLWRNSRWQQNTEQNRPY